MNCKGAVSNKPYYISGDLFAEYKMNEELNNMMTNYLIENLGKNVELNLMFLDQKDDDSYEYIGNLKYHATIQYDKTEDYYYIFTFSPLYLQIRSTNLLTYKPCFTENTVVVFTNFSEEECNQYNVPYINIDI